MRLGFVGAGRIGRPMVARLVAAGHEVRVLARSDTARRALAADGAKPVADVAEVAADAAAVGVCVFTDEQVREVCLGSDLDAGGLVAAMEPGAVLVVHTTGSPNTVAALAAAARPRGIDVIDAPISGGPHDVAAGRVTLFVGAEEDALERARPMLAEYGDPLLQAGPPGSGQLVKLVNNAVFAANIGIVAHAVELATRLGIDERTLLGALAQGSGASRALAGVARSGAVATFAETVGEFVGKDVAIVRDVVAELGVDLGPLAAAHRVLTGLI